MVATCMALQFERTSNAGYSCRESSILILGRSSTLSCRYHASDDAQNRGQRCQDRMLNAGATASSLVNLMDTTDSIKYKLDSGLYNLALDDYPLLRMDG